MNTNSIRSKLDSLITTTNTYELKKIPSDLYININQWKWGQYGWISPVSLIFTATWVKAYFPEQDCCKIWSRDELGRPISGSFSIRSEDEGISIPLLAKHGLCQNFCSDNSGMQGSRAIEKMRSLKRLNKNFDVAQRTIFDLKLFAKILNQINELNTNQAIELLKYLVVIAKKIKENNSITQSKLLNIKEEKNPFEILKNNPDPELVKCVAAACYKFIFGHDKFIIEGVSDHKTSADARSQKAGDFSIKNKKNSEIIAVEVKASSIKIDWQNIQRAENIVEGNPLIKNFIFVHENPRFIVESSMVDIIKSDRLSKYPGSIISFVTLNDLYKLASAFTSGIELSKQLSEYITLAPSIKPITKQLWLRQV
jgi:hypothetical protein